MPDSAADLLELPAAETAATEAGLMVTDTAADDVVDTDLLVEEISIDGMCGVY